MNDFLLTFCPFCPKFSNFNTLPYCNVKQFQCKIFDKIACTGKAEELCTLGTVTVLAQGDGDEEDSEFWDYLERGGGGGSSSRVIGSTATGWKERKNLAASLDEFKPKLFVVDADPTVSLKEVGLGTLIKKATMLKMGGFMNRGSLDDNNVFLLDTGWKIFVWIGKAANPGEKVAALGAVDRYAESEPRAKELPVTVVKAGQERGGFFSFFK